MSGYTTIDKRGAAFGSEGTMAAPFDHVPVIKRDADEPAPARASVSGVGPTPTPTPSTDYARIGLEIALAGAALVVLVLLWKKYASSEQ
ncbi:hypothetical protein [Medusavirus stheno T3]|uniref:Uncharacterized protein n=1 Tax=Medusavirus stheno T3 TaxID=3069717 RepID=A0A7S7YG57_9VIRU|nr:hypothetical protein QKU73_gp198 [Acanthamoeba castellanii medusavirus]QPB44577.1 hypothetical protein [Medusavirus stheno T3]